MSISQVAPNTGRGATTEPPITGAHMEGVMKKLVLAAAATLALGMGAASAQEAINNVGNHLPSPAFTYSPANG